MTTFEIGAAIVAGIVIIGAAVVIYYEVKSPTPPPPPPPPPTLPPPPPPVSTVTAAGQPQRFKVVFTQAPTSVKGKGHFTVQVVPLGAWKPTEVADFGHAAVECSVEDGDGAGIISAMDVPYQDPSSGLLGHKQALFQPDRVDSSGAMSIEVVATSDRAGVDELVVTLLGSAAPPARARYNVSP
jgi:hypothetical protein